MLISRVPEEGARGGAGRGEPLSAAAHEYRTANELFDLMARSHNFQPAEDESLTTRDLVLLYKNIDLGTKLMSNANEFKLKAPNQYVETIVYEDLDSDSELSEIYSNEDIHNIFLINKERIDLLNNPSSLENTLCHKFGDLEINSSSYSISYNKKFMLQDPIIKDQLKSLDLLSNDIKVGTNVLPASLLDYICCKHLEDNYNFYMDNIIKYVKHTIDQLKRISNGDYLTEKAKEKWREVENKAHVMDTAAKVLSNCTSIPLYVEAKSNGHATKWDDLVHSEVDVRSLSKILEKKIVVEVPKTICGSYKLFSKCCKDNLIISCSREREMRTSKRGNQPVIPEDVVESRVDVVLQLDRSDSGHVISNISSIMFLQTMTDNSVATGSALPLPYKDDNTHVDTDTTEESVTILEISDDNQIDDPKENMELEKDVLTCIKSDRHKTPSPKLTGSTRNSPRSRKSSPISKSVSPNRTKPAASELTRDHQTPKTDKESEPCTSDLESISTEPKQLISSDSSQSKRQKKRINSTEDALNIIQPDELRVTLQRLNMMQASLEEEELEEVSVPNERKKKSPTRNRLKSPYENKSHLLEEKKRKRLLEIKQRREKKKLALTEKLNKHKFPKGVASPHTASSITKLSITNKSFYDSIYGQPGGSDKSFKAKAWRDRKDSIPESYSENENEEQGGSSRNHTNKSSYLNDAVTEMCMQVEGNNHNNSYDAQKPVSDRSSLMSSDLNANWKLLSQFITPSGTTESEFIPDSDDQKKFGKLSSDSKQNYSLVKSSEAIDEHADLKDTQQIANKTMQGRDKHIESSLEDSKKVNTTAEFRKSIDKIYELMHKLGKNEGQETKLFKSKFTAVSERPSIGGGESSTIPCSESGTSNRQHLTSSNPSCSSFDKTQTSETPESKNINKKLIPRVIISTKAQKSFRPDVVTPEVDKIKKDRKKPISINPQPDNPLKAISQLLQEIDNVQKVHIKSAESKMAKKSENKPVELTDTKNENRQSANRHSRIDTHLKEKEYTERHTKTSALRERRAKMPNAIIQSRFLNQTNHQESKPINNALKKRVVDIVDELKEARGEAVRGPSKPNARLNSLAQPKKTYVQAQIEEFQSKYGKSLVTDRLKRLNGVPTGQSAKRFSSPKSRRRSGSDPLSPVHKISPPAAPETCSKNPANINIREVSPPGNNQSSKQNAPETPDAIKKKMVAVESYVKNHYGRTSPTSELLRNGQKSRVPFFPNDIDSLSFGSHAADDASPTQTDTLHDTVLRGSPQLTISECIENHLIGAKAVTENTVSDNTDTSQFIDSDSVSKSSDLSQCLVTNIRHGNVIGDTIPEECENYVQPSLNQIKSMRDFEFENPLQGRMSLGTIHKCLTLSRKLSPKTQQQVLLLQSGDSNSVLMKSRLSQNINSKCGKDLGILPELSNLDWKFTQFPVQIATVGYTFPRFQHNMPRSNNSNVSSKSSKAVTSGESNCKSVSSQCFKGTHIEKMPETAAQVNIQEVIAISNILKFSSSVIKEENEDVEEEVNFHKEIENNSTNNRNTCNFGAATEPLHRNDMSTTMSKLTVMDIEEQNKDIQKLYSDKEYAQKEDSQKNDTPIKDSQEKYASAETPLIEYTTSLDILAGLLNEIQKISTCQTQIANCEADLETQDQREELECILKSAVAFDDVQQEVRNIISISSLDKLRHLESNPSLYSFYLSNNGDNDFLDNKVLNLNPRYADKEVHAVIRPNRECVNKCTDVPSRFFPITVNHSTNASNSLIGVLSQPSSHSVFSYNEHPLQTNESLKSLRKIKKIIKLKADSITVIKPEKRIVREVAKTGTVIVPVKKTLTLKPVQQEKVVSKMDPMVKVKRDILVTMYSVLVLTVFAALSFPDMLYRG